MGGCFYLTGGRLSCQSKVYEEVVVKVASPNSLLRPRSPYIPPAMLGTREQLQQEEDLRRLPNNAESSSRRSYPNRPFTRRPYAKKPIASIKQALQSDRPEALAPFDPAQPGPGEEFSRKTQTSCGPVASQSQQQAMKLAVGSVMLSYCPRVNDVGELRMLEKVADIFGPQRIRVPAETVQAQQSQMQGNRDQTSSNRTESKHRFTHESLQQEPTEHTRLVIAAQFRAANSRMRLRHRTGQSIFGLAPIRTVHQTLKPSFFRQYRCSQRLEVQP